MKSKKQEKDNNSKSHKYKIVDMLNLPKDVMLNLPLIYMEGKNLVHIENYKGIIEYSNEQIRLNTNIGVIKIIGKSLHIKSLTTEEIVIDGFVHSMGYM